jgi:polysaccharide export outer membrane protein
MTLLTRFLSLSMQLYHLSPMIKKLLSKLPRFGYALLGFLIFSSACTSTRKLNYFDDHNTDSSFSIAKQGQNQTILKGDILYILVNSADLASNAVFNAVNSGGNLQGVNLQYNFSPGYLVEEDGTLSFPKLGKVMAAGKNKASLKAELELALLPYLKDPSITIRYLNFRVTVLGEVARPGTYVSLNERMTLLEVIGQAGDLTDFGKRENVLLIRETDQEQQYHRINLNDRSSIAEEFYYLRPNDVLYIEPIKSKRFRSTNFSQVGPLTLSAISVLISTLFYFK